MKGEWTVIPGSVSERQGYLWHVIVLAHDQGDRPENVPGITLAYSKCSGESLQLGPSQSVFTLQLGTFPVLHCS